VKIKVTASLWSLVGCKQSRVVKVDDEDLEGLDENQRRSYLDEIASEQGHEMVSIDWDEVE
jgi:hypothetical protein